MAGNINLETADDLYDRLAYTKAASFYQKYLNKHQDDLDAWLKLADCYDKVNNYEKLSETLKSVVENEALEDDIVYLEYAKVLQVLDKPSEAATWYQKFLDKNAEDARAKNQLAACKKAIEDDSDRYTVNNMEFNTDKFEYAPNYLNGTFVYTSTSGEGNTSVKSHNWTNDSYSDLKQYDEDTLGVYILFNDMHILNTKFNDGPFVIDPSSNSIFYTRNNYNQNISFYRRGKGVDKNTNLLIYVAEHDKGNITNVTQFEHNFEGFNTGHPAISPDGSILVFTSDKTDSTLLGERNLYYCKRDTGVWSAPIKLSSEINTEGDELFPYFHQDGSLFFASDGLGSYGGLDIFRAEIDFDNNEVRNLEHLPYPMNSTYDDFGIIYKNENVGYFTSDRPDGQGNDDIYRFVDNSLWLKGTIVNIENEELLPGAFIRVADKDVKLIEGDSDDKASFETRIVRDKMYDLFADEELFLDATKQVSSFNHKGNQPIEVVMELTPIKYNVQVLDAKTKQPITGATVDIDFGCDKASEQVFTSFGGKHGIPVYKECDYKFKAKADGYLAGYETWTSPKEDGNQTVTIYLDEISYAPIVLKNIYYDFDESYLRLDESYEDLQKVYKFLVDNPELTVQINSHTDARGSHAYNEGLSQRRAQSVVNYLVNRNIPLNRLVAKGYGENVLVNHCSDGVKCSEEDHQLNRRTEFQVINVDGSTKIKSATRTDIKTDPCKGCPF